MLILVGLATLFALGIYRLLKIGQREAGLPPGPPTIPLFGNMLQMPRQNIEWQ